MNNFLFISIAVGFSKQVSCTKSVTVQIDHGRGQMTLVGLKQGGGVEVNGVDQTENIPLSLLGGYIRVRYASPIALVLMFDDGLQLTWDGFSYAYIDAPGSYSNKTAGLCGNFDGNPENDLASPNGGHHMTPDSFGNEWRVKEVCDRQQRNDNVPHPCRSNAENQRRASNVCAKLKSPIFKGCDIDPEPYHKDCMYDMCACKGDAAKCMCTIFSAYANECSRSGKPINWRESIRECGE